MKIGIESSGKTKKFKGNSKEKDCLTKKLILETISVDPLTAKEIFERSGYTGTYKTLTGVIARYQRYGYITREGNIPYHYFLTNLGFQHLENPKLGREAVVRAYKERMMSALIKYAGDFDDETLTELFKGRVVTPTVQNNVTEKVIQNKEPTIKILNPSEGLSDKTDRNISLEIPTTRNDSETIAELLEENERLKEDLRNKEDNEANEAINKEIGKSESTIKTVHDPKYNQVLLKNENAFINEKFFKQIPYKLLVLTATGGKGLQKISQSVKDYINEKFGNSKIIILPNIQVNPFVDFGYARLFTKDDFNTYKPKLLFGKKCVYVRVKAGKDYINLELCNLPAERTLQKVIIIPRD